jgi:hypothetical protein
MDTQAQTNAIQDVGNAFATSAPSGLTPAQQTAVQGVKAAFTPTNTPKPVTSISTAQGIDALSDAQKIAAKLTPPAPTTGATVKTVAPAPTGKTTPNITHATFVNPHTEQTATVDSTDQASVSSLLEQGYQFSDGTYPSSLASTPEIASAAIAKTQAANDLAAAKAKLTNFNTSNDPVLQNILAGINAQWDQRISQFNTALDSRQAALTTTGIRGGSQWTGGAGGVFGSILSANEQAHASTIASLEAQKNAALASAQQAFDTQQWSRYNDLITNAQKAYTDQVDALNKLQDAANAHDATLQKQILDAKRSNAVGTLMSQGITDPAQILTELQKNGDSTIGASDVSTIMKNLTPTAATGDTFKFSQGQISQLYASGFTKQDVQALQDYYNGRGSPDMVANLTPEHQQTLHDALNGTAAKKAASLVPSYAQRNPKAPSSKSTYSSGSLTFTSSELGAVQQKLLSTKGPDGYIDPYVYQAALEAWTSSGGLAKDFIKNFPVKNYINPAATWMPAYIASKTSSSSNASGPATNPFK